MGLCACTQEASVVALTAPHSAHKPHLLSTQEPGPIVGCGSEQTQASPDSVGSTPAPGPEPQGAQGTIEGEYPGLGAVNL